MTSHPLPPHVAAWLHDAARHLERVGRLNHPLTIPDLISSGIPLPLAARRPRQAKAAINRILFRAFDQCEGDCLPLGAYAVTRRLCPPRSAAYTFSLCGLERRQPANNL